MRKSLLLTLMAAALVCAPAAGADGPETHGADPASIDAGPGAGARASSSTWCGEQRSTDDLQNEVANGEHRFHAIYAIPADAPSRLESTATKMQRDAFGASALLERSYGRAIRYDLGTVCGPQNLDITVLRLKETTAELQQLAATGNGTLDAIARGLDDGGFPVAKPGEPASVIATRSRNWLVWLDGPAPEGACGQAMLYDDATRSQSNLNNQGGKVAVIFRGEDGFCGANSVRHEIGHNLGAVGSEAPHSSGGHCTDAIEDTMCVPSSPEVADGRYHELFFDYGNDDYWDPPGGSPLPWWTVNLSRFVCPDTTCNGSGSRFLDDGSLSHGVAGTTAGSPSANRPTVRLRLRARRGAGGRWRITLSARGRGSALVTIRCRRARGRAVTTVFRRRASLPRTIRTSVRCASRPRAAAVVRASR